MPGLLDPTEDVISPEERRAIAQQNLFSSLLQGGMQMVAAGDNLYPWQRAQMLGQVAQTLGGMPANNQQMLANAAQQKLVAQRVAKDKRAEAADAELAKVGENPAFLETLKQMPADMQSIIPALFKSGRARDAVTLVDNWRTNQQREQAAKTAADAAANKLPFGWERKPDGSVGYLKDGPADPEYIARANQEKRGLKVIPTTENDKLSAGATTISNIDSVLADLNGKPAPSRVAGWASRNLPGGDLIAQTIDPEGVNYRGAIANVASQILQARSGLAVTEGEYRRLTSMLPNPADDPETIKKKLADIRDNLAKSMAYQSAQYTKENGYVPHVASDLFTSKRTPEQTQDAGSPPASALKEGIVTTFGNGQKWTMQGGKPVRVQ